MNIDTSLKPTSAIRKLISEHPQAKFPPEATYALDFSELDDEKILTSKELPALVENAVKSLNELYSKKLTLDAPTNQLIWYITHNAAYTQSFNKKLISSPFYYIWYSKSLSLFAEPFACTNFSLDRKITSPGIEAMNSNIKSALLKIIDGLKLDIDKIYIIDSEIVKSPLFESDEFKNNGMSLGEHLLNTASDRQWGSLFIPYMLWRNTIQSNDIWEMFTSHETLVRIQNKMGAFAEFLKAMPEIEKGHEALYRELEITGLWYWLSSTNEEAKRKYAELDGLYKEVMKQYPLLDSLFKLFRPDYKMSKFMKDSIIKYINAIDSYEITNGGYFINNV